MKAWDVCDEESCIQVRAETRGRAKWYWPEPSDFLHLRVTRAYWLDGGDTQMEIHTVWKECHGPYDEHGDCFHDQCYEGYYLDEEATLVALQSPS